MQVNPLMWYIYKFIAPKTNTIIHNNFNITRAFHLSQSGGKSILLTSFYDHNTNLSPDIAACKISSIIRMLSLHVKISSEVYTCLNSRVHTSVDISKTNGDRSMLYLGLMHLMWHHDIPTLLIFVFKKSCVITVDLRMPNKSWTTRSWRKELISGSMTVK